MKLPKKIKIGGIVYKITMKKTEKTSYLDRSDDTINLNLQLTWKQKEIALLHEIIHGINLAIQDEVQVEALAQALHQVITDNKLL